MATPASQQELNKFVEVVDEFMANYAHLISPAMRSEVYASNNSKLISDYETAVSRGGILKRTIETTVGAWNAFKRGYASVTDTTSMYIGDAVDWIRGLFGDDPYNGNGMGAIQIPAAAVVAAIIATALVLNKAMGAIFVSVEANRIQRENPGVTRERALAQAQANLPSILPKGINVPMLAAAGLALYFIFGRK